MLPPRAIEDPGSDENSSPAWYFGSREDFVSETTQRIADRLSGRAAAESLAIEAAQNEEWLRSVNLLQKTLDERIPMLRELLTSPDADEIEHVILEYDFRRRGLRIDCLLLARGVLFVVEFKRTKVYRSDLDQVMTYAVNLIEFHEVTQSLCADGRVILVPIVAVTDGRVSDEPTWPGRGGRSWDAMASKPLICDRTSLGTAIRLGVQARKSTTQISARAWIESPFSPSSSILDATLSLYGNHDVVAIQEHALPKEEIDAATSEIRARALKFINKGERHLIFLSGAPGAGKTLVGLDLVLRGDLAREGVFVTGNAPLVDVLNKALGKSFRSQGNSKDSWATTGYRKIDAPLVASAASFKIVKAHNFLGKRGNLHRQNDGRLLVFDEAQRTYESGRMVRGEKLADHEADLILDVQERAFASDGAVIVALVGHNQAINRGERGIIAWLEAAERRGWSFSISDQTLSLVDLCEDSRWAGHPLRMDLVHGHLDHSMRYYRNKSAEEWVGAVLDNQPERARVLAAEMHRKGDTVWLTRSLSSARSWARERRVGNQRAGLIASGQARRLAAEGLFVDHKPDIATWMLAPSADVRSSNALETVQNQYQIQGLELDYAIVCWDADLRRSPSGWAAFKLSGSDWRKDRLPEVAKNGYRVLLTRARKGMVIFVPQGDRSGEDVTRDPSFYDGVWDYLLDCGARSWAEEGPPAAKE